MRRLLFLFIFHIATLSLWAVPARRDTILLTLPDGSVRAVVIRGDERCHWLETLDGQFIGDRVMSRGLAERAQRMNTLATRRRNPPAAESPAARVESRPGDLLLEGSFPTTGRRKLLALLINYQNTTPTFAREQFERMLNEEGYNGVGSFRDYFLDQSNGLLDITTTVTPWITVSHPKQYYNIDNTPSLIEEALKQIDGEVNLRDYDNDGDGILDGLIVIHAGEGQEASGNATDIWSHSSTIYGMQFDGVSIYRYTIEPEILHGAPSTIGVFCHEFGHNLGALDYYDTNYSSDGAYGGTGPWDLMGEGAWNGSGGTGTHPAPFTAWQKWQFGWLTPEILDQSRHITDLEAGALNGRAFRMNTTTEGDYFVLENIQSVTPWTSDLPGHGLLVTHVVESIMRQRMAMNNINASYPQGIYTVCADAHSDPIEKQPSSYGDLTSSATPFPGTRGHSSFSDETLPSTHSQDGRYGYIALQNISESNSLVTFDFIQGDAPQRPTNVTASVRMGAVNLTWDFPADKEQPVSCNVYREGRLIGCVRADDNGHSDGVSGTRWTFTDTECTSTGKVHYTIDATYRSGLTSAVTAVDTRIAQQVATDLVVTPRTTDDGAEVLDVTWNIGNTLTRCVDDLHYELVDHSARTFRYAHRFRADDLLPHIGRQVKSVSFIPQQRSTDASYKICVWRMAAKGGQEAPSTISNDALELVAERSVTEFSPSYKRDVLFVSRPTLERGYDYLIGVEITSKSGLAEAVSDQSELQQGYGNLMSINGGAWTIDPVAKGNYIITTTLTGETPADAVASLVYIHPEKGEGTSGEGADEKTLFDFTWRPYDVDADLFLPLGFTVFGDGLRVAETTGQSITLPLGYRLVTADGLAGETTISLASTYKGRNLSSTLSATVTVGDATVGINGITAAGKTSNHAVDLSGRRVSTMTKGIFIIDGQKIIR